MGPVRCVLLDDEPAALERLVYLLEKRKDVQVVARLNEAVSAAGDIAALSPELVFIDVEMPGKTGFDVVREVRRLKCFPTFIFVTAYNQYAIKAIRNAVFDFILKPVDVDELNEALERFLRDRGDSGTADPLGNFLEKYGLTKRERQIVVYLKEGKSSREIADLLFLSKSTVDTHRRRILKKTARKTTAELIAALG